MQFRLYLPFSKSSISQGFGQNATDLYKEDGLKGHPAIDYDVPWGTPILNCIEGSFVYSTRNKDNPDPSKYRAVYTLWDDPDSLMSYELVYGHCSDIQAEVGTTHQVGSQIASVGNTGDVYANGNYITTAEKLAGSHAGAHLHFQLRQVLRVKQTSDTKQYLYDGNGLYKKDGYYYEVINYDGGYNGCIDPTPFFHNFLAKDAEQTLGLTAKLVSILKALVEALLSKKK